jgi:tetratricopeptide (TPR) repeat protein
VAQHVRRQRRNLRACSALYRDAWLELTWTLAELGRAGEAETAARRAVDINNKSAAAHANLATTLLRQGRPEEALPAIGRSNSIPQTR